MEAGKYCLPWRSFSIVPANSYKYTYKKYYGITMPVLRAFPMKFSYRSGIGASYQQWQEKGFRYVKESKARWSLSGRPLSSGRLPARYSIVSSAVQVYDFEPIPQDHAIRLLQKRNYRVGIGPAKPSLKSPQRI